MFESNLTIPQNLENLQLPSPELLTYYTERQHRVMHLAILPTGNIG